MLSPTPAGSIVIVAGPLIVLVLIPIAAPDAPVTNSVAVTIPDALMFVAFSEVTVETPEELMLPLRFPVTLPEKPLVAVMIPDATTLVKEIFGSRLTVTALEAADDVRFVPPEIVKVSLRRSIFSEPESPETVSAVPTAAVVTAVTKPFALTVTTGIRVCEPKDPTLELTVANVVAVLTEVMSPVRFGILVVDVAVPVTLPTKPEVAVTIPDALILVALRLVIVPVVLLKVVMVPAVPVRFVMVPLVMVPLVLLKVVMVPAVPVILPTNPEVAVTIPDALMFVAFSEVTVETPEELMLPVTLPDTLPVKAPTNPSEEVVIPVTTTPEALVSNAAALTSPVRLPTKPEVAVMTPDALTLVSEIFGSRLTVTVFDAAEEVRLVPPEIVKDSLRRSIFSEPESPATVNAVPTDAVPAAVKRPFESTVNVGIWV